MNCIAARTVSASLTCLPRLAKAKAVIELLAETSSDCLGATALLLMWKMHTTPGLTLRKGRLHQRCFHGNVGSFWNRDNMYKSLGYDYFFDANDFLLTEENSTEYGLKDKLFFQQSAQYLEQLQQPFMLNTSPLSNHFLEYDEK